MEIRRVQSGEMVSPAPARPAKAGEKQAEARRPSTDRVELSRQWVERMEERRAQAQAALLSGGKEKKAGSILDMLDVPGKEELEAQMEALKVQQRCLEIARRMMSGKRVPPEDERYLMEHDPEGYKLIKSMCIVPEDDEECDSVLEDEEDNNSGGASASGEAAPVEVAAGGGDAPPSSGGEAPSDGGACE